MVIAIVKWQYFDTFIVSENDIIYIWLSNCSNKSGNFSVEVTNNVNKENITKKLQVQYKATSVLAGFYVGPLSRLNWNLHMLVFVEGGKPEYLEKNHRSKARTNNKLNPHSTGWNQTQATLVVDKCSHHCAIPAPQKHCFNVESCLPH